MARRAHPYRLWLPWSGRLAWRHQRKWTRRRMVPGTHLIYWYWPPGADGILL